MDRDRRDRDRDRDKERDRDRSSLRPNGGRHSDRYPGNHHPVNGPRGGYSDGYNRNFNGPPPHHHGHNQPFGGGGGGGGGGGPPFRPVGGGGYAGPMSGRKRDSGGGFASSGRGQSPDRSDGGRFVKLFVGSVPRTATEDDIRPLFEEHGYVLEVAIVKDRRTGQQQGFCFVKYATQEEADRAIRSLHNQVTLLGGLGPIQVKYADAEKDRIGKFQGTSFQSGASEPKLFVATLNKHATEKEVEEIFAPYGHVEDVYLMKDDFKQSRGCGFVRFSNRDMAVAAMNALNGTYVMRGCEQPIVVRFAEPKRPRGGDSRPGPTFGGPGFGPRSQQPPPIRSSSNMGDFEHGSSSPWHPMSPHHGFPSSQFSSNAFVSHLPSRGAVGSAGSLGGPTSVNNSLPNMNAALSTSQQGFNSSMPPMQPFGQPIPPLQMLQQPSSVHLQPQLTSPFPQMQSSQTPIPQLNPMQLAQPGGPVPLPNLSVPAGISGQQSVSQPQPLQAGLQSSLNISSQQQLQSNISTSGPNIQNPQLLQPLQQVASQVRPQQQSPAVPSGFHSIPQQAFPQPQQQLHLMQRQPSTQIQQHNLQATSKPQTSWNAITPHTMGSSAAAPSTVAAPTGLSSTTMAASVTPIASLTCNWTEHTSPEGYKYYYNSVTSESKWEKPEELALFEQQQLQQKLLLQQQQKLVVQPMQSQMQGQPLPQALSNQQTSQVQQTQIQVHPRQPQQLQIQQPSMYHGSATSGQHNVQGVSYSQPMGNNLVTEPSRLQQGLQSTQEWMWKNKPTGN